MPSAINELQVAELKNQVQSMGSCLLVGFEKLTVAQAEDIRREFRKAGFEYRVVKNRLARVAFREHDFDIGTTLKGMCGVVFAPEERAIEAAKLLREHYKKLKVKEPPINVIGAVIEGEVIGRKGAKGVADMADRQTVQAQLASVLIAPARGLAAALNGLASGMARCIQAKVDKEGGA
ncbi:MAG: 50S ribosomal protein L10 [Planctomycetota bacterium]